MRCSGLPNEHHVQGTLVLLPAGAIYRGTLKPDSVGKVLSDRIPQLLLACGRGGRHPQPDKGGAFCS